MNTEKEIIKELKKYRLKARGQSMTSTFAEFFIKLIPFIKVINKNYKLSFKFIEIIDSKDFIILTFAKKSNLRNSIPEVINIDFSSKGLKADILKYLLIRSSDPYTERLLSEIRDSVDHTLSLREVSNIIYKINYDINAKADVKEFFKIKNRTVCINPLYK